jgi:hypothetical protein
MIGAGLFPPDGVDYHVCFGTGEDLYGRQI